MRRYAFALILCLVFLSVPSKGRLNVAGWRSFRPLAQAGAPPQASGSEGQLQKENDELRKKLDEYKKLEEDMVAQRIADKARTQVLWWLGFGGLAVLVTGALGFKALLDYTKALVIKSIESITKERLEAEMLAEGQRQVKVVLDSQKEDFLLFAKQQYTHLITSMEPLGAKEALPALEEQRKEKSLDYSSEMLPVRNQSEEGSSVAFAFAEALEFQIEKKLKQKVVISPRFIYYLARKRDGTLQMDAGTTLQSAISVLKSTGAVPEEAWPYKAGAFQDEPPEAVQHARHYKIKSALRVNNTEEIKSALKTYGPLVTGVTIYQSAFDPGVAKTGILPLPGASETPVGGHALCIVGYDDDKKLLKAKNHWGADWGDGGYAYLPYTYAERFLSDTFAITLWLTKADLKD